MAVGNVPFGSYGVIDKRYAKHNFYIHDYFIAKCLDKVRPGGIAALITSKGTLDKQNSSVRKYLAQHAELVGAIRLPNNAFKANAGTEVTSDILFLKNAIVCRISSQRGFRLVKQRTVYLSTSITSKPNPHMVWARWCSGRHVR